MKNGENDSSSKIYRRHEILSQLDSLIKESVYYRAFSFEMQEDNKIVVGSIEQKDLRSQII